MRDPSAFAETYTVRGVDGALVVESASVSNAVVVIALDIQRCTGKPVEVYFEWADDGPLKAALRTVFLGRGQVATVTREILSGHRPDQPQRARGLSRRHSRLHRTQPHPTCTGPHMAIKPQNSRQPAACDGRNTPKQLSQCPARPMIAHFLSFPTHQWKPA